MKYPQKASVDGKTYYIETDYHIALECFRIIEDETISDTERALAVIYKLFNLIPTNRDNVKELLRIAGLYLGCGESQDVHQQHKKDFDFDSDWKYIAASFMTDYQINLDESQMHWYQFINLIQGLTDSTILSRVRELRNYDLSEVKDLKVRNKIINAQKKVAFSQKHTQEEQNAIDEFESLFE